MEGYLDCDVRHWPPRLRKAVAEIVEKRGGQPLAPEALTRLADACAAGERAERGISAGGAAAGLLGRQATVGNVTFETPTLAARIFLEAAEARPTPPQWLDRPEGWRLYLTAFACAHGREPAKLAAANSAERCRWAVEDFAATVGATDGEVAAALAEVQSAELYPPPRPGKPRLAGPDWHTVLSRLAAESGTSMREWLYGAPDCRAMWALSAIGDSDRAAARDPKRPDPEDPMIEATATWKKLEAAFKEEPPVRKAKIAAAVDREIEVREMTWGELKAIEADGSSGAPKLPMEWPLEQQFKGREGELSALGVSEVRRLSEAIYSLTFGGEA